MDGSGGVSLYTPMFNYNIKFSAVLTNLADADMPLLLFIVCCFTHPNPAFALGGVRMYSLN